KPLLLAAIKECNKDGRIALRDSLAKKFSFLETNAPAALSTLPPAAWKKQVTAFRLQLRQIAEAAPARDAYLVRITRLSGRHGVHLACGGPNFDRVKQLSQIVTQLVQKRDYANADKALNDLEALLATPPNPAPPPSPEVAREIMNQFKNMVPHLNRARKTNP